MLGARRLARFPVSLVRTRVAAFATDSGSAGFLDHRVEFHHAERSTAKVHAVATSLFLLTFSLVSDPVLATSHAYGLF